MFKNQDRILEILDKQNKGWQDVLSEHNRIAESLQTQVREAHNYQREEHKKLMEDSGQTLIKVSTIENKVTQLWRTNLNLSMNSAMTSLNA